MGRIKASFTADSSSVPADTSSCPNELHHFSREHTRWYSEFKCMQYHCIAIDLQFAFRMGIVLVEGSSSDLSIVSKSGRISDMCHYPSHEQFDCIQKWQRWCDDFVSSFLVGINVQKHAR